jgi:hypothetical protein
MIVILRGNGCQLNRKHQMEKTDMFKDFFLECMFVSQLSFFLSLKDLSFPIMFIFFVIHLLFSGNRFSISLFQRALIKKLMWRSLPYLFRRLCSFYNAGILQVEMSWRISSCMAYFYRGHYGLPTHDNNENPWTNLSYLWVTWRWRWDQGAVEDGKQLQMLELSLAPRQLIC